MESPRLDDVCASLADQLGVSTAYSAPSTLAVALGANLASAFGPPRATLRAVRPELEQTIHEWLSTSLGEASGERVIPAGLRCRWSPLFETDPVGGPPEQPVYINAVVVVDGPRLALLQPCEAAALSLLVRLLALEKRFGRDRQAELMRWESRSLDLDLLAWGALQVQHEALILPHPRLIERSFVVVPLAAALTGVGQVPRRIPPDLDWLE